RRHRQKSDHTLDYRGFKQFPFSPEPGGVYCQTTASAGYAGGAETTAGVLVADMGASMRVLITGAAGFLGEGLVQAFDGHDLRLLDVVEAPGPGEKLVGSVT